MGLVHSPKRCRVIRHDLGRVHWRVNKMSATGSKDEAVTQKKKTSSDLPKQDIDGSEVHPSFQEERCTASILSSHGWSVSWKICWFSASLCLLAFQRWEKALGIPHRSWLTDGNPLCGWARANSDVHLVRTDEGFENQRGVRRLAEHSWSEDNLRAVVETPQNPKSTIADIPPAAEPFAPPHAATEVPEDDKEEPAAEPEEDDEMRGSRRTQ